MDAGEAEYVDDVAPRIGLALQPGEVYHWYEYGGMPPVGLAVRVTDCPIVIDGAGGVIAPADGPGLTVTVVADEVTTLRVSSSTCNSNL